MLNFFYFHSSFLPSFIFILCHAIAGGYYNFTLTVSVSVHPSVCCSSSVPHIEYRYLNLLDSPELLQMLVTLTAVIIKPLLPKFLGRAIVILNFVKRFRNFIAHTVPW